MGRHIHLVVSFTVQTEDDDTYIPAECRETDSIMMTLPNMDPKNIVFPKIVEGATVKVIERHALRVSDFFHKKAEAERKEQERRAQLGLWGGEDEVEPEIEEPGAEDADLLEQFDDAAEEMPA